MINAFQGNGARVYAIESYPSLQRISGKIAYPCREVRLTFIGKRRFVASTLNLVRILSNGVRACLNDKFDLVVSAERNFMNVLPAFMISRLIRRPLVVVIHHAVRDDYVDRREFPLR